MKKIEIHIREINLDDDFNPIEDKCFTSEHVLKDDDGNINDILDIVLDDRWSILKGFYLRKRKSVPFRKLGGVYGREK